MVVSKSTNNVFSEGKYVKQIPQIHVNSFKTLDARASGLNFPTPYWACPDGFTFTASKLWIPGPGDCIFQHFIEPEACPEGGIKKYPYCFFHWASVLTNIPKIHVYSLKTLDARAWGLHFPTPYWAWSLTWMWYQKVPIMFFHSASMLTKIPKIRVYSFKTLDARARGLHFPTPYWAWSMPWRWYQKVPILFFKGPLCWPTYSKSMFTAWKLWTPGPGDCIF